MSGNTRSSATKSWSLLLKTDAELISEEKAESWVENPREKAHSNITYVPHLACEKTGSAQRKTCKGGTWIHWKNKGRHRRRRAEV